MPRTTLTAVLLVLVACVLAVPTSASAEPGCRARHGERVRAHGPLLAVLETRSTDRDFTTVRLRSCDPRTGRRKPLTSSTSGWGYTNELASVRVAGRRVAVLIRFSDKYMNSAVELAFFDVRTGYRAQFVVPLGGVASWDLGPDFEVAMARYGRIEVWRPRVDDLRTLARGTGLSSVSISGGLVRWSHGPRRAAAPLALGVSSCPPGIRRGTPELDLLDRGVCWRATGVVTAFADGEQLGDFAGPFVATRTASAIVRRDARDGSTLGIPFDGPASVLVSRSGNLAWLRAAGATHEVWVHDGEDTHRVGETRLGGLSLDGETLTWLPGGVYVLRASSR